MKPEHREDSHKPEPQTERQTKERPEPKAEQATFTAPFASEGLEQVRDNHC